jgi:hypothetical protein
MLGHGDEVDLVGRHAAGAGVDEIAGIGRGKLDAGVRMQISVPTLKPIALALAVVRPSLVLLAEPSLSKRELPSPWVAQNCKAGPLCMGVAVRSSDEVASATSALRILL